MSYQVQFKDGDNWIARHVSGLDTVEHLTNADTAAHKLFKSGKTSRVVTIQKGFSGAVVLYTLSPETHRVDENGRVCPILPVPDGERRRVGTIDLTPTWSAVLPILILALTNGTDEGRKMATEELKNMAKAADAYNSSVK